ncbi:DUF4230 domain-containing protein [Sphingosinicella xenopeptidilytica]|uniref:DUF4230 domain-containing protein n=1 Tax=Sphingosinicella xenopeptidilytica TaxID=364098 RepID=A0ABW3BZD7_SPHXN|nr:DUF4230 domain-containing protein [Sphingosinicella sp.]
MKTVLTLLAGLLLGALAMWFVARDDDKPVDAQSIAAASLDAVRAQNKLTVFAGRFTVAVSTRVEKLGLSAEKTLIVPATVRYDIDYSKLGRDDIVWDEGSRVMTVRLPDIQLDEPQVDMANIREYGGGTILMALGNAEEVIDTANRRKIREAVLKEADTGLLRELARSSARTAVERGFALPLAAAGIDARVIVRFPDESGYGL